MTDDAESGPSTPKGPLSATPKGKPCPICGKPAMRDTKPFCSKRCADVDLHRWLGGAYAIPLPDDEAGLAATGEDDGLS